MTTSLKLLQESYVILVEITHIVNIPLTHYDTFDTHTEGKAGVFFGIDAASAQYVGMYHARAQDLDPALALAQTAALAAANEAGYVNLRRGLGKGEMVGTEAKLGFGTEHLFGKQFKHTL